MHSTLYRPTDLRRHAVRLYREARRQHRAAYPGIQITHGRDWWAIHLHPDGHIQLVIEYFADGCPVSATEAL